MTAASRHHDPSPPPGKTVPDAIGQREDQIKSASHAAPDTTTPAAAFNKLQQSKAVKSVKSKSQKVPGKAVPDALRGTGKH